MKNIQYKALEFKRRGANHKCSYNQDYTSVRSMTNGIIAAVADGCSSEVLSGIGAYFICEAITDYFSEIEINISDAPTKKIKSIIDNIISNNLNYLCDSIKSISDLNGSKYHSQYVPAHIFSCTIIVAISFNNGRQIIYHIGDGVVLGLRKDNNEVDVLSSGKNIGEQSRTYFATDFDFSDNVFIDEYINGTYIDLFLTTDGLQKAFTDGNDTLSNLKALLKNLSDYGSTTAEEFNTNINKAIESVKKISPSRVGDDISCIWISESYSKEIFNTNSSISVTVKSKPGEAYEVTHFSFKNSKVVMKFKKQLTPPKPLPGFIKTNNPKHIQNKGNKTKKTKKINLNETFIT